MPSKKAMLVGVALGLVAIFLANRIPAIKRVVGGA